MTSLLRVSERDETRILARIGAITVLLIVIAVAAYLAVKPIARAKNLISVAIETPYVGQGVAGGTPVIMHGVKVGQVIAISSLPGGRVRLNADLQPGPTTGLTDTMGIDFRPSNYFGVTGINLIPGDGGQPLRSGTAISVRPKGNFALQALLYRLGELSNQVVTNQLVNLTSARLRPSERFNWSASTLPTRTPRTRTSSFSWSPETSVNCA